MKILVTGGTGFLGTRLIDVLLGEGHQIVLLARKPNSGMASAGASGV